MANTFTKENSIFRTTSNPPYLIRGKVRRTKLSLSIPYKQRLNNIALVFESLANQTMKRDDFEVIVGAMEYCEKFVSLCKKYTDRINIVSVLSPDEFSIPHARNLAMRHRATS